MWKSDLASQRGKEIEVHGPLAQAKRSNSAHMISWDSNGTPAPEEDAVGGKTCKHDSFKLQIKYKYTKIQELDWKFYYFQSDFFSFKSLFLTRKVHGLRSPPPLPIVYGYS